MIVLDLETSGLNTGKCGIWQIGAIELEKPENYFFDEARIDDSDVVEEGALKITGKAEDELRNPGLKSQKQMILNFLEWAKTCGEKLIVGQNIGWDMNFLHNKCLRYGIYKDFGEVTGSKGFDLYVLAQLKYLETAGRYRLRENGRGSFSLPQVLEFCGVENPRMELHNGEVVKEGKAHDALEDCKLEGECFSRLVHGKNLFPEYAKFEIPEHLKKKAEEK